MGPANFAHIQIFHRIGEIAIVDVLIYAMLRRIKPPIIVTPADAPRKRHPWAQQTDHTGIGRDV